MTLLYVLLLVLPLIMFVALALCSQGKALAAFQAQNGLRRGFKSDFYADTLFLEFLSEPCQRPHAKARMADERWATRRVRNAGYPVSTVTATTTMISMGETMSLAADRAAHHDNKLLVCSKA